MDSYYENSLWVTGDAIGQQNTIKGNDTFRRCFLMLYFSSLVYNPLTFTIHTFISHFQDKKTLFSSTTTTNHAHNFHPDFISDPHDT